MMREIKFDIVARNIHFNEIHHHQFTLDQIWEGRDIDTWLKSSNAKILAKREFTGLKDKNGTGVEAYEGDLVQRRDGKQGEIIWHQESCGFAIAFGDDEPLGSLSSWFEVVGNKYEN